MQNKTKIHETQIKLKDNELEREELKANADCFQSALKIAKPDSIVKYRFNIIKKSYIECKMFLEIVNKIVIGYKSADLVCMQNFRDETNFPFFND
jgi:hypothetical protein